MQAEWLGEEHKFEVITRSGGCGVDRWVAGNCRGRCLKKLKGPRRRGIKGDTKFSASGTGTLAPH